MVHLEKPSSFPSKVDSSKKIFGRCLAEKEP